MLHEEIGERTIGINFVDYRNGRSSVGFETEKMGKLQAFTGTSTTAGDRLTSRIKPSSQPIDLEAGKLIRCSIPYTTTQS